ncbi:MAG TPA: energy transducer TonB [Bacteroidota bacterium]|nr:energy transducer TonB [Bacteroidota bacterium]
MALLTQLALACLIFAFPGSEACAEGGPQKSFAALVVLQDPDIYPVPTHSPSPAYPESARRDSVQGTVYVEAVVDQSGRVQDAKIKTGVRRDLDDAALACMRQWTFRPAQEKGKPVRCTVVFPFQFRLKK